MWIEVLATVLGLVFLALAGGGIGAPRTIYRDLIDIPSVVAILLITLPIFFQRGMWKDFGNAVKLQGKKFSCSLSEMKKAQYAVEFTQKQLLYAGGVTLIYGIVSVFNNGFLVGDIGVLGPCFAIALLCPLYTMMLELLILPLEIGVKRRIADYMEEE